jgi:hypothetical protein
MEVHILEIYLPNSKMENIYYMLTYNGIWECRMWPIINSVYWKFWTSENPNQNLSY